MTYNFKYEYCEICGKDFEELYKIDPKNEPSWFAQNIGRKICKNCAKPMIPELRMEASKDHREECSCHSCIIAEELGYVKKNNKWVKSHEI